ncbi:MAG TPA: AMP-binding protein, partial [Thermoanaerobaculia bacterium]|nr:AMP-binding protein [Thermoanaerobaculia bacterium]
YVIYTSGSTGAPKGVAVEHRQLANYIKGVAERLDLSDGSVYAMVSTFAADLGNTVLFPPLCGGGTLHLIPDELTSDPVALAAALERDPVDCMKITPSHLEALIAGAPSPRLLPRRCLVLGGEASNREWVEGLVKLQPGLRVVNHYGPTETTVGVLTHRVGPGLRTATLPLGRPLPGTTARLLGEDLTSLPSWFPGEIYLGGAGVARGYLGRPDLTADCFVPDLLAGVPGARMYRTGDLARGLPDGTLEFIGRADHQVKIRGFRIELGEIETVLERDPEVRRAAVAALDDDTGSRRLVAYAVAGPSTRIAELRERLRRHLPEFMIPAIFVFLDALPLNANGKVDRRALPKPDWRHLGTREEFIAPETATEQLLAGVWAEVLGAERVGAYDNFFLLGGDSIRAIVIRARAEERGAGFSIKQIFDHPVLRDLARDIEEKGASATGDGRIGPFALLADADRAQLPEGVEDAYPLARLQAGMLFHSELAPGTAVYHDIHSHHVHAPLDLGLLRKALEQAARRHPVLRTSFDLSGSSEPLQLVHAGVVPPLEEYDLSALSAEAQEAAVRDWLQEERQRPFDWSRPPLVSFHAHRRSGETFQFTMSFHHSILDGWSSASLLTELFHRYLSLLDDADCAEEEPPSVTLSEFVHLERAALASAEAREFWCRHLAGSTLVRLPRRQQESGAVDHRAEHVEIFLPLDLSDGLKRVALSLSLPIKSVLMAVHFRVLGLLSGLTDVMSGVVSNGRPERTDGERALGLFLNTLPLRMALPGGAWSDLAHAAFELERGSHPFRRFPLSELQRLEGGRTLFEVAFNFLHFHVYDSLAQLPGAKVLSIDGYEETNFALITNFQLTGSSSRILLRLSYQLSEHSREEMEEVARRYLAALEGMAASPQAPYDTWPLLTQAERDQLLAWNRTSRPAQLPLCVHETFEAQVERTPEAPAAEMDAEQLTYRELDRRAARLARRLRAAGVGPDDPVGMCLERSLAVPVAVLGILKAGGAYLPLDPAYPAERLAAMAGDARLRWLVCDDTTLDCLPAALREQSRILRLGPAGEVAGDDIEDEGMPAAVAPENLAYVLYTSGSTGRPKGVAMPHAPLANLIDWQIEVTTAPGPLRTAQFSALSFDASFHEMFTTWGQGGTLV